MSFFNPYLVQRTFIKKVQTKPKKEYTRIIPKCFKIPGEKGIISVTGDAEPVCFVKGIETPILYKDGNESLWSFKKPKASQLQSPEEQPLTFHIYDIVETCYNHEKCETVPFISN